MTNETSMNPLFFNRTVSRVLRLYVIPEIEKRVATGSINAESLPIEMNQFRVSYRKERKEHYIPVVEINNEVKLIAGVRLKTKKTPGEAVALVDIDPKECFLEPPKYDGKPAGYFYWRSTSLDHIIIFDLSHSVPDQFNKELPRGVHFPIADFINAKHFQETIKPLEKFRILSDNNWPPAPGYYPQIMSSLHSKPTFIMEESFVETVSSIYNPEYWKNKLAFLAETGFFPGRIQYISRAIKAHYENDYIASIHIVVPQFEGIITDYLATKMNKLPKRFSDKLQALRERCLSQKVILYPKEVLEVIIEFIDKKAFWKPSPKVKDQKVEINRHGIAHGAFTDFECKEISLKLLILLDALVYVLLNDKVTSGNL